MDRVARITAHPRFRAVLRDIEALERERPFCGHGLEHLLAVARLAWIYNLEEGTGLDRPLVYAAALLHDLGRAEEYRRGTPHEQAGAALARGILTDCGFPAAERERICAAILCHRGAAAPDREPLSALLHRADKRCRPCYLCAAAQVCNWPEERRSHSVE